MHLIGINAFQKLNDELSRITVVIMRLPHQKL